MIKNRHLIRRHLNGRSAIGPESEGAILPSCDNQGEREGNDDQGGSRSEGDKLRQGRRIHKIYKRYVIEEDKKLLHRSWGQPSNRSKSCELREIVLDLYGEQC